VDTSDREPGAAYLIRAPAARNSGSVLNRKYRRLAAFFHAKSSSG